MKKMNILIVHNYYQVSGGEDSVVSNEGKLLKDKGNKVILYSRNNIELKSLNVLQKLLVPFTNIFSLRTFREVQEIIKKEKIDIVHVHNTMTLISPSVYYAAFKSNIPVMQTIHNFRLICPNATLYREGNICEDCVTKGLSCAIKNNCYRNSKIQSLACVASIFIHRCIGTYRKINYICLTEFNKEKLMTFKQIKSEKIFIKPNFVGAHTSIIPYVERKNQFVFAGRLDSLKGIEILFNAWNKMGNNAPKLVVCGTGPMENWCKDYIRKNNITNIQLLGFIDNTQVKQIIANSKALVLPTQWYEGFPMNIVESYSCGTPVIGSAIGNVGNIITPNKTGWLFKHDNVDELIKAINGISDISDSVFKEYNNGFSPDVNYQSLIKIYEKVLSFNIV